MKLVELDPRTLKPNPENYRGHPQEQIAEIATSLRDLGQFKNVVVRPDGTILAGHGVVQAAIAEGVPVVWGFIFEGTDAEARRLMVADNELSRGAEDDERALHALLNEINRDFGDLAGTGWSDAEHEAVLKALAAEDFGLAKAEQEDPGAGEVPEEPQTRLGDVWLCGEHRVVCGDSTQEHVWESLGGEIAGRVAFWSPPYALGGAAKLRGDTARGAAESLYIHEEKTGSAWRELIDDMTASALAHAEVAVVNVQPLAGNKRELVAWLASNAERLCDIVTWDKGHAPPQMAAGVLASRYEWLVILAAEGASRAVPLASWKGTLQSVYEGPPQRDNEFAEIHGATFPTHLPLWVMGELCDTAKSVADCCLGSGTTLIAAEKLGRVCYGIELEPRYVDVALRRWAQMTGEVPTLEADGTQFEVNAHALP